MAYHIHARGTICPLCNKEVKPTGSAYTEAIVIGNKPVLEDVAEAKLAYDPDAEMDKYFASDDFESRLRETIERNEGLAASGNLAPIEVPNDQNSRKVLEEQSSKIEKGVAHGV